VCFVLLKFKLLKKSIVLKSIYFSRYINQSCSKYIIIIDLNKLESYQ